MMALLHCRSLRFSLGVGWWTSAVVFALSLIALLPGCFLACLGSSTGVIDHCRLCSRNVQDMAFALCFRCAAALIPGCCRPRLGIHSASARAREVWGARLAPSGPNRGGLGRMPNGLAGTPTRGRSTRGTWTPADNRCRGPPQDRPPRHRNCTRHLGFARGGKKM